MANWKTYKITSKEICSTNMGAAAELLLPFVAPRADISRYIKFGLDGYIRYRDGDEGRYVCCENDSPFNNWSVGDYIEVDNGNKHLYSDSPHFLDNSYRDAIRFVDSQSYMALVSIQNQNSSLQQRCSDLVLRNENLQVEKDNLQSESDNLQRQIRETFTNIAGTSNAKT